MSDTDEQDGLPLKVTQHGFEWGPVTVTMLWSHEGRAVVGITTATGRSIGVYVSRTGRSVRVFGDGAEWKPQKADNDE